MNAFIINSVPALTPPLSVTTPLPAGECNSPSFALLQKNTDKIVGTSDCLGSIRGQVPFWKHNHVGFNALINNPERIAAGNEAFHTFSARVNRR